MRTTNNNRGISLLETIVYIAILSMMLLIVVSTVITMGTTIATIRSTRSVSINAANSIERMTREIRAAGSVSGASVLDTNPGTLVLIATSTSGTVSSVTFSVSNNRLYITPSGGTATVLTGRDVTVENLIFRKIVASSSVAVKIEMKLTSSAGKNIRSRNYYDTAVLRGSYQ